MYDCYCFSCLFQHSHLKPLFPLAGPGAPSHKKTSRIDFKTHQNALFSVLVSIFSLQLTISYKVVSGQNAVFTVLVFNIFLRSFKSFHFELEWIIYRSCLSLSASIRGWGAGGCGILHNKKENQTALAFELNESVLRFEPSTTTPHTLLK